MKKLQTKGSIEVEIPAQNDQPARTAEGNVKLSHITFTPPRNHPKKAALSNISLYAIYVKKKMSQRDIAYRLDVSNEHCN